MYLMWSKVCKTMDMAFGSTSTIMQGKFDHKSFSTQDTIDQYIDWIISYQERLANIK